jgi:hypothetical protein
MRRRMTVHFVRERVIVGASILTTFLAALSCSGTGGTGVSSSETPSPAAQATPAAATTPDTRAETKEPSASEPAADIPEAPELRPENAAGALKGTPAATNTVPIVAVANYFADLPGIDIAALKRGQKEKFLQRVNSEICSCGCKNDTLAKCYVNDPHCPLVKTLVQKVYDEVKTGK